MRSVLVHPIGLLALGLLVGALEACAPSAQRLPAEGAALEALGARRVTVGERVTVAGPRGGTFRSVAGCAPDGVLFIAAGGDPSGRAGCYAREWDSTTLRAEWTMAVPDDDRDDREALAVLFRIAAARRQRTVLTLAAGVYDLSALCSGRGNPRRVFDVPSRVTLRGAGMGRTTLRLLPGAYPTDCAVLALRAGPAAPIRDVVIEDLTVDMNGDAAPMIYDREKRRERPAVDHDQSPAIELAGHVADVTIRRVRFLDLHADAVRMVGATVGEIVVDRRDGRDVTLEQRCEAAHPGARLRDACAEYRTAMLGDWTALVRATTVRPTADSTAGYHTIQRVVIDSVVVERAFRNGISLQGGVRHVTVSNSTFRDISDQSLSAEPSGSRAAPMDVVLVRNRVESPRSAVVVAFGGAPNWNPGRRIRIEDNVIGQGATPYTLELHHWHGAVVRGNVIGGAIHLFGRSADVTVERNEVTYDPTPRPPAALFATNADATYGVEGLVVRNNIFHQRDPVGAVGGLSLFDAAGVVVERNEVRSASGQSVGIRYRLTGQGGLAAVTEAVVAANTVDGFAVGLAVTAIPTSPIPNLTVTGNTFSGPPGTIGVDLTGLVPGADQGRPPRLRDNTVGPGMTAVRGGRR